ncbi:MAG: DNA mismatch repair protein MutL [Myxococcota bacterium]|nr:DNA mismatch repair protein MutL [Myxococcota bacterium]
MNETTRRIRLLPPHLADRIAAGEVVERPASVLKELVENALDAGATLITVEIEGAGSRLIRVTDNGCGMSREDLELAVRRHATSKLASEEDLFHIRTLGFRGEAIPSIASVSRFSMASRTSGGEGHRIQITGGQNQEISPAGLAPGTSVEVRDLFFNVPARRKFLKSPPTEESHLTEAFIRLALLRSDVRFRYLRDGRESFDLPAGESRERRITQLASRELERRLLAAQGSLNGVEVRGYAGYPEVSQSTQRLMYTYVNGRFVRDRGVQRAILDAYENVLPKGRYPAVFLEIVMDPGLVDVNVHPQKVEVRFENSGLVYRAVREALTSVLRPAPWARDAGFTRKNYVLEPARAMGPAHSISPSGALSAPPAGVPRPAADRGSHGTPGGIAMPANPIAPQAARPANGDKGYIVQPDRPDQESFAAPPRKWEEQPDPSAGGAGKKAFFSLLRPVGQFAGTYLVAEGPDGLVVVDQHAAHERVTYTRLMEQYHRGEVPRQVLLLPVELELNPAQRHQLSAHADELEKLGFVVEPSGPSSYAVREIPEVLAGANVPRIMSDLLDEISSGASYASLHEAVGDVYASCACHSSVRAGDRLTHEEIMALFRAMDETEFSAHCPHGRPVSVNIGLPEIARWFHRT